MGTFSNPGPLEPWYVTGLAEGSALLTYNRSGRRLAVVFAMRSTASGRPLLEQVRRFFGDAGRIYRSRPGARSASGWHYRIVRPPHLLRVVHHLDEHPFRGPKAELYRRWREMVLLRAAHAGVACPPELDRLAQELSGPC